MVALWLVCAACLAWIFWPLSDWIRYPLVYEGDGLWNLFVIKTVLETGWYGSNDYLGAPFTANFLDFAKPESLYLLMFRMAGWVTGNAVLIHNLFYFLVFSWWPDQHCWCCAGLARAMGAGSRRRVAVCIPALSLDATRAFVLVQLFCGADCSMDGIAG
ncbi:MAG: hypothetical protein MZV65_16505 [Chromatiales bacterium]|nr:hypothetical protein [Chromatiales bacterium]